MSSSERYFWAAFTKALTATMASELGDKTFFVAAMLSMKHSPFVVFIGAATALLGMTVLSVVLGALLPKLFKNTELVHYLCVSLFLFFGGKLLLEGLSSAGDGQGTAKAEEEMREVELEIKQTETTAAAGRRQSPLAATAASGVLAPTTVGVLSGEKERQAMLPAETPAGDGHGHGAGAGEEAETGWSLTTAVTGWVWRNLRSNRARVLAQAFLLTFLGEWGDRSQITTITMSATYNPKGVATGSFLGHVLCTGLAVVGGKVLAQKISPVHVNIVGGLLFLGFGLYGAIAGPEDA